MRRVAMVGSSRLFAIALAASTAASVAHAQPALPASPSSPDSLSIRDLLELNTVSVQDLSADGRWLAVTRTVRRDGLGVNYYRDNDPTYLRTPLAQLMVVDTRSGAQRMVFPNRKTVRNVTWSPDGAKLAMFVIENDALQLTVWDRASGRTTVMKLPAAQAATHYVAENSELRWNEAGTAIHFALRSHAWKAKAVARFALLTKGPIVVLDAEDDFLEWDEMRRLSAERAVASWDVASGAVTTLVPEQRVNSWTVATDESAVVTNHDLQTRTTYGAAGAGGRASKIVVHAPGAGAPRTLFETTQGAQISWAPDGTRYALTRDGRVFIASIADTAGRQILGATGPAGGGRGGRGGRGGAGGAARGGAGAPRVPVDTAAARAAANERFSVSRWRENGEELLASNRQGIWVVNVASGARDMIIALPDSGSTEPRPAVTTWSADGRYVYFTRNSRTEWNRSIVRYDRETRTEAPLVSGARFFNGLRLSDDGSTSVLTIADGNRIADVYVGDGALGNLRRIVESNPQLAGKPLAKTELIRYRDADGANQYGVLFYPARYEAGTRYPTVFILYEQYFNDTWDAVANLLSSNGYAVVKPSVTLETGYPGEGWLKGVTAAANHVIDRGIADSARLGVHGTSYGGYATNLLITQTRRFAAAINMSGKVDMISFYTDSPRLGARNINAAERSQDRIGATLWEQPHKYVAHSAVMFADRITTPLLLLTGGQDHNVPELNEREMYYALRRLGKPVTWVSYVNAGHGTPATTETEFVDYHQRILEWYGKHLAPKDKKSAMN